jgi:hypothetical protein
VAYLEAEGAVIVLVLLVSMIDVVELITDRPFIGGIVAARMFGAPRRANAERDQDTR